MRFLYNKLEQKKSVGLFANGSYKLAFLLKKIPFNNLSHGRWTYVLLNLSYLQFSFLRQNMLNKETKVLIQTFDWKI